MKNKNNFNSFQVSSEAIPKNILQNLKGGTTNVVDIVTGNIAGRTDERWITTDFLMTFMDPKIVNQDLVKSYNDFMISRGYDGTNNFELTIDVITGNIAG